MSSRAIVVLDVGKTLAKLSLWSASGDPIARATRANARAEAGTYAALDVEGIEAWMGETLREFAARADIGHIVPVAHGAAFAVLRNGALACPPLDYEQAIPAEDRHAYDRQRDAFADTGSPALPDGLNMGAQLHFLERLYPDLLTGDATIVPWAQYWGWLLTGVAASEATSLGCHSDLWRPFEGRPSALAERRGWAERLAPLVPADRPLGTISPQWAARSGLPEDTLVLCGLHDSNAALQAARAFPRVMGRDATMLSTGTWFVAMRSLPADRSVTHVALPEGRDCLLNVDVAGRPVPSARFMGGREVELLSEGVRIDREEDQPGLLEAASAVVGDGIVIRPTAAPGCGPFPDAQGGWIGEPAGGAMRGAAICLYLALVADEALDLIGASDTLLVEGRFAATTLFVRALARLRPDTQLLVSDGDTDVSFGALRLVLRDLPPRSAPVAVEPLDIDLATYKAAWRTAVRQEELVS